MKIGHRMDGFRRNGGQSLKFLSVGASRRTRKRIDYYYHRGAWAAPDDLAGHEDQAHDAPATPSA